MDYTLDKGNRRLTAAGCKKSSGQMLSIHDWLADIEINKDSCQYVEVQFKNTRKGYYLNSNNLSLEKGDIVAVESNPGHDIGTVTMQGYLVALQMRKNGFDPQKNEIRRVYRKARTTDIEKWEESKAKEHDAMLRTRKIAKDLNLDMKIGDVEYQGDGNKAIFYYIADERVDFRQLIKVLAEVFQVRIEMKQIGARQEAGRIGGTGPCGRELCCSTFLSRFSSVGTNAARVQDLSMNPQKLAGQCAKLKCCLNFELDNYIEAIKEFPDKSIHLETENETYYFFKLDAFARKMTYSTAPNAPQNLVEISLDRAKEVIAMNEKGQKPESLSDNSSKNQAPAIDFTVSVGEGSLTRFDNKNKKKRKKKNKNKSTHRAENNEQKK
ncbi:MAG: regulatory iron-sulfur-containing complex subunit RicT [Paludibacteraceae bacterium]|nr:regulatory iron-sulfur-containing complex subunit RicT [Paludibacteraceae bacterium]